MAMAMGYAAEDCDGGADDCGDDDGGDGDDGDGDGGGDG